MVERCCFCKKPAVDMYLLNYQVYCSTNCYYDKDKKNTKAKNRSQTNKGNKSKNQVHKKSKKQKKGSRK